MNKFFSYQPLISGIGLLILLAGVYLLVYRGHPLSIDEISMFDSIESFVNHGTFDRTIEYHRAVEPVEVFPFTQPLYEPMQIILISPLFKLAQIIPNVGLFHVILLFNFFITLLTAISIYGMALWYRYPLRIAWLGALLFGTATLALHYSRFLFREPLMGLFALWVFFLAGEMAKQVRIRQVVLFLAALCGMILTKQAGLLFLPGVVLCFLTQRIQLRRTVLLFCIVAVVMVLFLLAILLLSPNFGDDRYSVQRWINPANWGVVHMWESLWGYQISPARSFWLYSPVLLFGLGGAVLLSRRGRGWFVAGIVLTFLLTSAAYGALRFASNWNGGWNWGPRYMVPLIPVWMLLVLPALENILQPPSTSTLKKALLLIVVLWSGFMQLLSISTPFSSYYFDYQLQHSAQEMTQPWSAVNWSWSSSALLFHLYRLDPGKLDIAWAAIPGGSVIMLIALLTIVMGLALHRRMRYRHLALTAGVLLPLVGMATGLIWLQSDPRYVQSRHDIYALVAELNRTVAPDDVILLNGSDFTVMLLFMNWFKAGNLYVTLPYDEPPDRTSAPQRAEPLSPLILQALQAVQATIERVWLVTQTGIFTQYASCPLEAEMAERLYPVQELATSTASRAILYITAPPRTDAISITPDQPQNSSIRLISGSFPAGTYFEAGAIIPVSLTWAVSEPVPDDYHVSLQLLDQNGLVVSQRDGTPQGNTARTSAWQSGATYDDHHALQLPDNLSAGAYTLYAVMYRLETDGSTVVIAGIRVTDVMIAP